MSTSAAPEPRATESAHPTEESPFHSYRWIVCGLLFFATTINYVDRQILSLLKPMLDDEMRWTNEQFGMINSAFQAAYGVGLLGFGWFVDRYGTKVGYAVSIVAWSLAAFGHGLVGSVRGFVTARISLGLGEGGNFPSAIKAVALWFPKSERALATSLFNSGTNVGAIVAPLFVPIVAQKWGWKSTFIVAGAMGFMWLIFWQLIYNVPEKIKNLSPHELAYIHSDSVGQSQQKLSWGLLLKFRQTWSFVVGKSVTDPVWWFFLIWLPDYFKATRGLDIKHSWLHLVTIYSMVTVLSIIGGWVPGYLTRLGWSVTRARKTGMFIFALCVLVYDSFRYVSEGSGGIGDRVGRDGGVVERNDFSVTDRKVVGCVQSLKQCHRRIYDIIWDLRGSLLDRLRIKSSSRATIRTNERKTCLIPGSRRGPSRRFNLDSS
jgi:ACS family hexuronate transporter-like MFS transporter